MYGLIGNVVAVSGKRNELAEVLVTGVADMPGCLSYIVALDPGDPNVIWITEVWESEQAHMASLSLASVKESIAKGRPLISVMGESTVTTPIGGHGLQEPNGETSP
jgi:quinol monooxygenase YgiN